MRSRRLTVSGLLSLTLILVGPGGLAGERGRTDTDSGIESIAAKYPHHSDLVRRVFDEYYLNAYSMEEKYGLSGLVLLDTLGVEALLLDREYGNMLARVVRVGGPESVAAVFRCWQPLIETEGHNSPRIETWLTTLSRLEAWQMRVLQRYTAAR